MDIGLLVLRIAHIVAGASWVGGVFLMILIINRTAKLRGAEGEAFMDAAFGVGKGARFFEVTALTTVVAGSLLYWRASNGFELGWITSPTGIAFTIGAVAAFVSLAWGIALVGPTTARMSRIGAEVTAAGGVPTAEQRSTLERLGRRLDLFAKADLGLLSIAVVTMATARYL